MTHHPYRAHLEEEVLSADPVELVVLLFSRLEKSIRQARTCLAERDALGRSQHVSRAMEIVAELVTSLNEQQGGEIAANLRRLYQYLLDKLAEGHSRQEDAAFAEAGALVRTLLEAWQEMRRCESPAPAEPAYSLSCCG